MRGDFQNSAQGLAQAVAVLDLALGGVHAEMSDMAFGWFDVPAPVVAPAPVALPREIPSEVPRLLMPVSAVAEVAVAKAMPAAVETPGEVWTDGEAGGVLLVTQMRPDARCMALAAAMLAAAGVRDMPVAWVGYSGKIETRLLLDTMQVQAPRQVLVLGQAPLGVLLGRNLGVEGWHAAGNAVIAGWDGAPVGVTYPLELLLKQSLFKRLAWQHLLAWGETRTLTINDMKQGD